MKGPGVNIGKNIPNERDLGPQPLVDIMHEYALKPHDLVAHSTEQITHKMVQRAMKGRRLTPHVRQKIVNALMKATKQQFSVADVFNY